MAIVRAGRNAYCHNNIMTLCVSYCRLSCLYYVYIYCKVLPCSEYVFGNPADVWSPHDSEMIVYGRFIKKKLLVSRNNLELFIAIVIFRYIL